MAGRWSAQRFGGSSCAESGGWTRGDFKYSGSVGFADLGLLLSNYGSSGLSSGLDSQGLGARNAGSGGSGRWGDASQATAAVAPSGASGRPLWPPLHRWRAAIGRFLTLS
jgi:hypothetical protein